MAVCIPAPVDTQVSPFTVRLQGTATLLQNDDAALLRWPKAGSGRLG